MNETLRRIYTSGYVEDDLGNTYKHKTSSVTLETGRLLYDVVRAAKPEKTLEIGLAYGLSALFICQAHRDKGSGTHMAIDPFEKEKWRSIGLLNLKRADLLDIFCFHEAKSEHMLPQLCAQHEWFDFVFIDGSHLFDYTLVDFFYVDKLLKVGGYVAFDDLWVPGVRKVASFVLHNKPYELVNPPSTCRPPVWKRVLRIGRRIVQNPLGRDWRLKFVSQNVAVFQKKADDSRGGPFHRQF